MRYLSFSPWRVTGSEFIQGYQAGTDSFSENEPAKYAVNLLSDLGTKGYFEPGFASVDFTSACNLFFGGTGAIFYTGSGQISLAEEMYDNGELGFFPVPDTEGMDNMATNVPIHAGFAEGFNKAVIGQPHVIKQALSSIYTLKSIKRKRPVTLLFLGDSGIGKTETAKYISECLGSNMVRIQFSMQQTNSAYQYIFGADHGEDSLALSLIHI